MPERDPPTRTSTLGALPLLLVMAALTAHGGTSSAHPATQQACAALPDRGEGDPAPRKAASAWRLTNLDAIGDHWVASELTFYGDANCTQSLRPLIQEVLHSESYDDPDGANAEVLRDGECNSAPGFMLGAHWAGGDSVADRAPRGTYVGYRFAEPVEVACVRICQSFEGAQRVRRAMLQAAGVDGVWRDVERRLGAEVSQSVVRYLPVR